VVLEEQQQEGRENRPQCSGFWTEAWMFSGDPMGDPMPLQDPKPPEY
jgi:hypothetical protein